MGGNSSHEFIALSEVGEGVICYCDESGYAATDEKAEVIYKVDERGEEKEGGRLCQIHSNGSQEKIFCDAKKNQQSQDGKNRAKKHGLSGLIQNAPSLQLRLIHITKGISYFEKA